MWNSSICLNHIWWHVRWEEFLLIWDLKGKVHLKMKMLALSTQPYAENTECVFWASGDLDYAGEAVRSHLSVLFFFNVLRLQQHGLAVKLQKCSVDQTWSWVDNDWISVFQWSVPFNRGLFSHVLLPELVGTQNKNVFENWGFDSSALCVWAEQAMTSASDLHLIFSILLNCSTPCSVWKTVLLWDQHIGSFLWSTDSEAHSTTTKNLRP